METFKRMKYGMFIHYVASAAYKPDGTVVADADESAEAFNVESFAEDLKSFGVEYVVFTAWHFNMVCLYPSSRMPMWLDGHTVKRDLVDEIITALNQKGIRVILYTHPRDGHDFSQADAVATGWGNDRSAHWPNPNPATFNFNKWNDFLNDIYAELVERYGDKIEGIYIDEGSESGDSEWVVDYPRLRETIKSRNPNLVMLQNYYGNVYTCDFGDKEYCHYGEFASSDGDTWPCYSMPVAPVFSKSWGAVTAKGVNTVDYTAESLFRYTVLQAGANTDGGGVQWATGPYAGGGWETGVEAVMKQVYGYITPVQSSILQTYPSSSYITKAGLTINDLQWGVATRSIDDSYEYLHVLKVPDGKTLILPLPEDGKRFSSASLLGNGHSVCLKQTSDYLSLTLGEIDTWDPVNTVIQLSVI